MMSKNWMRSLTALASVGVMSALTTVTAFAEDTTSTTDSTTGGVTALISTFALPVLLLVFLYFIMIRPQQKADKAQREMQKSLQVGDEVITIGGIVGIVLRVEDNTQTVILETGSDRLKIRMMQDAIKENVTAREAAEAAKAEKKKGRLPKTDE
jgi:preprotein translocase subunit YajC